MKLNNDITKKSTGFVTPKAYFESFESRLMQSISAPKNTSKTQLPKSTGFEIPEAYFNSVEKSILDQTINQNKGKVISLWYNRIAKIAAVLLILITGYSILQVSNSASQKANAFSNISDEDLELYIENNILPFSEMRNIFVSESDFDVAENSINELNQEVILNYLDYELDDLDLLEE